jgi:hypothetical protein
MRRLPAELGLLALLLSAAGVRAQGDKPWILFLDSQSASACDVVNADNAELVVLPGGQMVIVSGTDVTLQDVVVDSQGFVFDGVEPAGLIDFALDGDGLRTLWWLSLVGEVARVNGRTGAPSFTDNFPEDYRDVPCDACDFWDDRSVCTDSPPVISICGAGIPLFATLSLAALGGQRIRRRGPGP